MLLHANTKKQKIDVQGRFEQVHDSQYGEVRATQLTAVAGKYKVLSKCFRKFCQNY